MAETSTIARPYAHAAFELAQAGKNLAKWGDMLKLAATVATDERMQPLLDDPRLTRAQLAELFLSVCGDELDQQGQNLIRLLAENRRMVLLPVIEELYAELRARAERTLDATVTTAKPIADEQTAKLKDALSKKLDREVSLTMETDESLLGGAVIRAGDMVIDGSVRGRLQNLASVLNR